MSTQLSIVSVVNMDTLQSLAREFREQFHMSSELIHESLAGKAFIFNRDGKDSYPFGGWGNAAGGEAKPIIRASGEAVIASTDSSCILLGESSEGAVYAVRAAVCFSAGGLVRGYFRVGPTIVFLSQSGACGLPGRLEAMEIRMAMSDHLIAERLIRNSVEKKIVGTLIASPEVAIVMADGSLKHPYDPYPLSFLQSEAGASLVGFSKSSSLIFSSDLTGVVSESPRPAYCGAGQGAVQTVVAKFSADGLVFRVDVARPCSRLDEILGLILSNDAFSVGYPESLRVAHHLSVFSRSEDTALKAYLTKRHAVKNMPSFGLRRIALGGLSNSG